ncbi:insulinase family protein [bacterium]|nr:insulinase family protein [bacterium]
MKKTILLLFFLFQNAYSQYTVTEHKDGEYTYKTVNGDLLGARIYTLKNGLTVYLSVYKNAPRIQTYVVLRTGSKQDPSDATGLAHYLEHLLFKGTDRYGTKDYAKEKIELDKIENLFEMHRASKDTAQRKLIYHQIDSISGVAAQYAIANEFDKMLSDIGAKGTNANTWYDRTIYINDIPSNALEKWLAIESERYRNPVFRIFHTELEAVYEEKNRTLDSDARKIFYTVMASLFKNHTYGTQTGIGTIEHLKNPSLKKIREFYNTYYVPNNMALCLSGDFDPDVTIRQIDKYFSGFKSKDVPKYTFKPEEEITAPIVKTVMGPSAESVTLAYRFPGANHPDAKTLTLIDRLLTNSTAGLIDLNLEQKQKVLSAGCSAEIYADYSIHIFSGQPREGQTLEEVKDLLLGQIDLVKKGEFDESMIQAIAKNMKIEQMQAFENNGGRTEAFADAFMNGISWENYVAGIDAISKISKNDVVKIANQYYKNNYVVVYKKTGADTTIQKIEKPKITPVTLSRQDRSEFQNEILKMKEEKLKPVFLDFKKDIKELKLNNGITLQYLKNTENQLFTIYYLLDMGSQHDPKLEYAIDLLQYLGTDKYSAEQIRKEFYKLGCSFGVSAGADQSFVFLNGLEESFDDGLKLFEHLLKNAKPDQEALNLLVQGEIKKRTDAKLSKSNILFGGLNNYATYGAVNPFTDVLSEETLKALKAEELVQKLHDLTSYSHRVLYYGSRNDENLVRSLNTIHQTPAQFKPVPTKKEYARADIKTTKVYFVPYDMVQTEIIWLSKSESYHPEWAPTVGLYNEYFGGGMSSIVFQTIRESKALAYTVFARYIPPSKKTDPYYLLAYVGTQADKMKEAIDGVNDLLNNLSYSEIQFESAKQAIKSRIESERITKTGILFSYEAAKKLGLNYDLRQSIYQKIDQITFDDVKKFQETYIKNKPAVYCIIGSKDRIKMDDLKKYGEVVELTLKDIFGY